jgi:hypothetical protein
LTFLTPASHGWIGLASSFSIAGLVHERLVGGADLGLLAGRGLGGGRA